MKLEFGSILLALACVLTSGAVRADGIPIIRNVSCHPEKTYSGPDAFVCVSNAVADAMEVYVPDRQTLDLLEAVNVTNGHEIVVSRPLELRVKLTKVADCNLTFRIKEGGELTVSGSGLFCGQFIVDGGKLELNGGNFFTDGVRPVICTTNSVAGETGVVRMNGASVFGIYPTSTNTVQTAAAVRLDGEGEFSMSGGQIAPSMYYNKDDGRYYTNSFNKAIVVSKGNVTIEKAALVVDDYGLAIGAESEYVGTGTFSLSNNVQVISMRNCGVYAYATAANDLTLAFSGVTISSQESGIKLDCPSDDSTADRDRHRLFLDGATAIRTRNAFGDYAITDSSEGGWWDVEIRSGTYYRMRKHVDSAQTKWVTNEWVASGCKVIWEPNDADAHDNLTMEVTPDEEEDKPITVVFDGNGKYKVNGIQCGVDVKRSREYEISYGRMVSVAEITPESLGITNAMSVFGGWYATAENARALTNAVLAVSAGTTLYAGWKPCVVTFYLDPTDTGMKPITTGLAWHVVGNSVSVDDLRPTTFDVTFEKPDYSFAGWCLDPIGKSASVKSLSVPFVTTLYAHWVKRSEVAFIEGTTNTYKTVAEAIAAARTNQVVVLNKDVADEEEISIDKDVTLALNGCSLGDAGRASGAIFRVTGADSCLQILGEEGTVYGTIVVEDDAFVSLDGGTYVSKEGPVVSANGTNYEVVAVSANFKGAVGDSSSAVLDFAGKGGYATVSNSTVSCVSGSALPDVAVSVANCDVSLVGTTLNAGFCGVMMTNGVLSASKGSSITAPWGIAAYPSSITVSDSSITSGSTSNSVDVSYAFYLMSGDGEPCKLSLSGKNQITGGAYDEDKAHPFLVGGAFYYEEGWAEALKGSISGGTYAHQPSNDVVMAWIATNCTCVWESETRFVVKNPDELFDIVYDLRTNLPKDALAAVDAGSAVLTNYDPTVYLASTNYFKFRGASCVDFAGGHSCQFLGWYLKDGGNTNQVMAITNGVVMVSENGKPVVTEISGDLSLIARWGGWEQRSCTVGFASGVIDKQVDEDDPEWVTYTEVDLADEEQLAAHGISVTDEMILNGLEFSAADESVKLPVGISREGFAFRGWAAYDPDSLDDPENPPTWTNVFEVANGVVEVPLSKFVDADGNVLDGATLHAVWDQGGRSEDWNPTFDDLYNDNRDTIMTGGDSYVGFVMDNGQVIGKVVAKLGVPRSDGSIGVSAKVTINGQGSRRFEGKGVYSGGSVSADLENGEDSLTLNFDSKTISGWYNGTEGNGYEIVGGVNLFKGSESDRAKAESAISPFLGRWLFIFATVDAHQEALDKNGEPRETSVEDGDAHAWGYSYVGMEIRDEGKVKLTGKLANGKEVSATATAIIGDRMMCVPATCSVYSGRRGGGFGFTAYFRNGDSTNDIFAASKSTNAVCEAAVDASSVSFWDSTMDKKMPFLAEVVYTNWQRVADIEIPNELLFCVDPEAPGLLTNSEKLGDFASDEAWLPLDPLQYQFGYSQYIDAIPANGAYKLNVRGKAPKMKLVDDYYIVPGRKGDNYASVKVKYDNKRGTFSGSFKVYTLKMDDETFEYHLKKTKVSVSGAMADGRGWGFGHHKKAGSQPITLEDAAYSNRMSVVDGTMTGEDMAEPVESESEDEEPLEQPEPEEVIGE